ncbi:MAG: hypothetical protein M1825_003428 [Sarcosagium campestre]|nr:MAG: hypothetical protein M1825_003428 [Sarcosagium campestre]
MHPLQDPSVTSSFSLSSSSSSSFPSSAAPVAVGHPQSSAISSKRKLPRPQPAALSPPAARPYRQSTLSEIFPPSRSKQSLPDKIEIDPEPNSKRLKTKSYADTAPVQSGSPTSFHATTAMYTSSKAQSSIIDLTKSPTPHARHDSYGTAGFDRDSNARFFGGAKKLEIKNLRKAPRLDPNAYAERVWAQLQTSLADIFADQPLHYSLEELYRSVENVCQQKGAPELFDRVRAVCINHVRTVVKAGLLDQASADTTSLAILEAVQAAWRKWNDNLLMILRILFFLDRSYLLNSNTQPTIKELGIELFRKHVFLDVTLRPRISDGVCDLVDSDRSGQATDDQRALLQQSIIMFQDMSVYLSDLEPKLLRRSGVYLRDWASHESSTGDLAGYAERCRALIDTEMGRCEHLGVEASTRLELRSMLDMYLLRDNVDLLTDSKALGCLLGRNATQSLDLIYNLLTRVKLGERLKQPWENYIKSAVSEIVLDDDRASEMVVRLLVFKQTLNSVWKTAFHSFELLEHAMRESFSSAINQRRSSSSWTSPNTRSGEMIAKYIDALLRTGLKAVPAALSSLRSQAMRSESEDEPMAGADEDAELEWHLEQVIDLFRFIEGKDVFEAFYKRDLARRLLMGRSASADAEKSMLARLKNECGSNFTQNLESMFRDIDLAGEEMASYKETRRQGGKGGKLDLNVNVLSQSAWPSYPDVAVTLPPNIIRAINDYESHYTLKHTGRKLFWKHALAHCTIKAQFPLGNKELALSSFQATVLLLFNEVPDGRHLTYEEIRSATRLSDAELKRTLQSLACAKYTVLIKSPKGREVEPTDTFTVNVNFTDTRLRVKINTIQLKETKEENQTTHENVVRDRQYETQAAIVRIMKARHEISAPALMAETISLTKQRGALEPAEIKKQIDKLIEKDYIERTMDENGSIRYSYLA